jgi:predicted nuclease of predicted toxin-antitoxin system
MRILADENFPGLSVQELRRLGHDVLWVRTAMPGARDDAILACAQTEERLLVTLDKDFGELAFGMRLPASCGVVLFWNGNFTVVEDGRIRMRPLTTNVLTLIK